MITYGSNINTFHEQKKESSEYLPLNSILLNIHRSGRYNYLTLRWINNGRKTDYLYSSQLLMAMSSMVMVQNALINALAKRALVIKGIFKSMAARRIL